MKCEYQMIVDSVRECLPLTNRLGGSIIFQPDTIRHEHINGAAQLTFLETSLKINGGDFFHEE